ncbi:MAG: hypothetical protein H6711_15480 [Myxococcales bacterium]|nr:hypothetical protein [Myxococcales bacterium]
MAYSGAWWRGRRCRVVGGPGGRADGGGGRRPPRILCGGRHARRRGIPPAERWRGPHPPRRGRPRSERADDLRVFDNTIVDNGVDHLRPVCGVFVLHGENLDIERNLINRNGERVSGDGELGVRAGIALQMAGRRVYFDGAGTFDHADDDPLDPAARVRGNTVLQPVGRALQLYGLGPMVVEGNHLVSGGLTAPTPGNVEAHALEIINLGQSAELIAEGSMPSFYGFMPAPPIQGDPDALDERLIDGRILYTDNQMRLRVMGSDAADIHCAARFLCHGDVMLAGNQHLTTLDRDTGYLTFSTIAIGWSVNASENRFEDTHLDNGAALMTDVSLVTTAALNITALNTATRCILSNA